MTINDDKTTRRESPPIKVLLPAGGAAADRGQGQCRGAKPSAYLLNVGIGYQIRGIVDHKQVEELARINGDLGRLGGLLKLWLTDDERAGEFGKATIRAVLSRIEVTQRSND